MSVEKCPSRNNPLPSPLALRFCFLIVSVLSLSMPPKPAPNDWKTGYQLEFLFGYWPAFKAAQDARTLDTFWKRVFEEWFHEWPVQATVDEIREYGPMDAAIMHQKEKKTVRNSFSHSPSPH